MDYNSGSARTKEDICVTCLHGLRDAGVAALDPAEFIAWVNSSTPETLAAILPRLGYNPCFATNPVDGAVKTRLGEI